MEEQYKVYARIDAKRRVTGIDSSAFLTDTAGWTLIDEGEGDRYHHAQANYLPEELLDDNGVWRYKLDELDRPVERTAEERAEDTPPADDPVDYAEEIKALKEDNRQLKEALSSLLDAVVEEDG